MFERFNRFLTANGLRAERPHSGSDRISLERSAPPKMPSMLPSEAEIEAAILRYRATLRDYETRMVLNMKADAGALDLAKIIIAEAVLRHRGIISYVSDSRLRMERVALAVAGENQAPPRPAIPAWLRWKVFRRDHYKCVECGRHWDLSADHVIPYSKGGPTTLENLQTLCKRCNSKKGARMP